MDIISGSSEISSRLKRDIERFGCCPEHNLDFLLRYGLFRDSVPFYFSFKGRGGALFSCRNGICRMNAEPVAGGKGKADVLLGALACLFGKMKARKAELKDFTADFRKEVIRKLPSEMRAVDYSASAICPIVELETFDENLKGKKWKRFRYITNLFSKDPKFRLEDPARVDKKLLKKMVLLWKAQRKIRERVEYPQYLKAIEDDFSGCDIKKTVLADKKPVALAAGWKIPNSSGHYIFMDIHDYGFPHLGEFLIFNYFLEAKGKGYKFIDFGGSDEGLLAYKNKFFPSSYYKTYDFSIVKR